MEQRFKPGDHILNVGLLDTPAQVVEVVDTTFIVQYSDDEEGFTHEYSRPNDIDMFILDQSWLNEQKIKKLLGVE